MRLVMTLLVRDEHRAYWILNNDADEFWLPASGDLKTGLARAEAAIIHCPRRNMMFPHNRYGAGSWYEELVYRVTDPHPRPALKDRLRDQIPVPHLYLDLPPKALCRSRGLREVFDGNHNARHDDGTRELWSSVQIYHHPVRSFDQFVREILNGGAAFERNTSLPRRQGWHWRRWCRMLLAGDAVGAFGEILPSEQRLLDDVHAGRVVIDRTMTEKIAVFEG